VVKDSDKCLLLICIRWGIKRNTVATITITINIITTITMTTITIITTIVIITTIITSSPPSPPPTNPTITPQAGPVFGGGHAAACGICALLVEMLQALRGVLRVEHVRAHNYGP
jgi:hypothetical protein